MRTCCTCKIEKSTKDFYALAKNLDGLQPRCKTCCNLSNKKVIHENREKNLLIKETFKLFLIKLPSKESLDICLTDDQKTVVMELIRENLKVNGGSCGN